MIEKGLGQISVPTWVRFWEQMNRAASAEANRSPLAGYTDRNPAVAWMLNLDDLSRLASP